MGDHDARPTQEVNLLRTATLGQRRPPPEPADTRWAR